MLDKLRAANIARNVEWVGVGPSLSLSFRGNELAGEVGETCNVIKKIDRERMGLVGSRATVDQLREELADILICVDLIAMDMDIDLAAALVAKFNKTSEQRGLRTRLGDDNVAEQKPHKGKIKDWHREPALKKGRFIVVGTLVDHPDFAGNQGYTSYIVALDEQTGELEARNSRYTLVGPEQTA
jgi:NTP pyrophosphatase (non-canonical NTP hydrolase)